MENFDSKAFELEFNLTESLNKNYNLSDEVVYQENSPHFLSYEINRKSK